VCKLDSFVGFIGDEQIHAQEFHDIRTCLAKHLGLGILPCSYDLSDYSLHD
jgi:hypothetical protein